MSLVTVIIRTKNEERWIGRCLRMVFHQKVKDLDVVIVDNGSTDHTVAIAKKYPVRVLTIDRYTPGRAINLGARESSGEFLACLSAHCIPREEEWLGKLLDNMADPAIAGVYGRQLPFAYSSDFDKRDLVITFGLDHRVQVRDSFFHNANSLVRRSVWDRIPFDETVTNIEDRLWGDAVIRAGMKLAYEPDAAVFHYHGIHQNRDEMRCQNIVQILEGLDRLQEEHGIPYGFRPESIKIIVILPVLGSVTTISSCNLLERCIQQVRASQFVARIVVIAENPEAHEVARACGVETLLRPNSLIGTGVSVEDVLKYALSESERGNDHYDGVLYANYLYPFRPTGLFDKTIEEFCLLGVDSVVPTLKDYQAYWRNTDGKIVRCDSGFAAHDEKIPMQKGMVGLGCIASSEFVRKGCLLGDNIALLPLQETLYSMKAGDRFSNAVIALALEKGTDMFGVHP